MALNKDFKEFIGLLNAKNVRYLVVGGYAVAFYGFPRYTKDIDIWLLVSEENAEAVQEVLVEFGMGGLELTKQDFLTPDNIIQLGYPPNRIDLILSCDGLDFETAYKTKNQVEVDGIKIDVVDLQSLKMNKRASGRARDIADLEDLESIGM